MIFDRQIAFWGREKQNQIENSSIFVAGIGGLGCLLSEILVRSGVGKIYICDNGIIDDSDINRQMLYTLKDVGKKKIDVAYSKLIEIHPHTEVVPVYADITKEDFSLPDDIKGIADCLDNFEGRFTLWDKLKSGLFYVHAGVEQFFGQVLTLVKGSSPQLSQIFANYDDTERVIPISATSASVVSSLASTEVMNNLFKTPKLLNTLLIVDLSDFTFSKLNL